MQCPVKVFLTAGAYAILISQSTGAAMQNRSTQNNPPETYIQLDTLEIIQPNFSSPIEVRSRKYYSLPDSTTTYPGIVIDWQASDSIDYPDQQPPFEFNWVLFGPYPDKISALPDSSSIVNTNDDPGTVELEWTGQTTRTFHDLRSGWYVFWVRARDDSLVADPTPAIARFPVVEPSFDKDFLLMDATNWTNGSLLNAGSYSFRDPRVDSLTPDTLRAFYENLFSGQGYAFDRQADTWYRQTGSPDAYRALPDRDILARYKALVIYDEDMQIPLDRDNLIREFASVLGEYMNVGGRVVLIGRNLFASSVTDWSPSDGPQEATLTGTDFGFIYFGVTRMYLPGHLFYVEALFADTADFFNVIPLDPRFPVVVTDTMLTLKLSQLPIPGLPDRDGDGNPDWRWIPDVNWIGIDRTRGANGFYQFNSVYPNTSPSQGRICGACYQFFDSLLARSTFRSAIVTLPLSVLKRGDGNLRALAKALLDYALSDSIETSVEEDGDGIRPREARLMQNHPNPFNAGTTIRYTLDAPRSVTITIYNALGQRIRTLVQDAQAAGSHAVLWNGTDEQGREMGTGIFFYRLQLDDHTETRKMLLLK